MELFGLLAGCVTILSFGFAVWQWRQNVKLKTIQRQNLRSLWDISRSYTPYTIRVNELIRLSKSRAVIAELRHFHDATNSIFRSITPMYIHSLGKDFNYNQIKCMIQAGEITGPWSLRLVLMEMVAKHRNLEEEKVCFEMLGEMIEKRENISLEINKSVANAYQRRSGLSKVMSESEAEEVQDEVGDDIPVE